MDVLSSLKSFVTIVEKGGIKNAAQKVHRTTSSLSKQLQALENHFNMILVLRTTRRFKLTRHGEVLYDYAKRMLSLYHEAEMAIHNNQEKLSGKLRIDLPSDFANDFFTQALICFLKKHPEVNFEISHYNDPAEIIRGQIDIMITSLHIEDDRFQQKLLYSSERQLFATPDYLKQFNSKKIDISDLKLIMHRNFLETFGNLIKTKKINFNLHDIIFSSMTSEQLLKVALSGVGVIYSSEFTVKPYLETEQLIKINIDFPKTNCQIFMYHQPDLAQSLVRAFSNHLLELAGNYFNF